MTWTDAWQGILDADESILWQGRPDGAFAFKVAHGVSFLSGLAFAGFALFWMSMASQAGGSFWMFGMIHFAVGIGIAIGPPVWSVWRRRHTWYTLTDRRAFVATDMPVLGRRLKSYPITPETVLDYDGGDPATIYFAHVMKRTRNGHRRVDIGFERIPEGAKVYGLMRNVQRQTA